MSARDLDAYRDVLLATIKKDPGREDERLIAEAVLTLLVHGLKDLTRIADALEHLAKYGSGPR